MVRGILSSPAFGTGVARSNVKIIGIPEAVAKLRGVDSVVRLNLGQLTAAMAIHMEAEAKDLVPVITGNLRSGISTRRVGPYSHEVTASSLAGEVPEKNGKEYANFVNNGTSKMAPRRFMETAAARTRPLANAELLLLARKIEHL